MPHCLCLSCRKSRIQTDYSSDIAHKMGKYWCYTPFLFRNKPDTNVTNISNLLIKLQFSFFPSNSRFSFAIFFILIKWAKQRRSVRTRRRSWLMFSVYMSAVFFFHSHSHFCWTPLVQPSFYPPYHLFHTLLLQFTATILLNFLMYTHNLVQYKTFPLQCMYPDIMSMVFESLNQSKAAKWMKRQQVHSKMHTQNLLKLLSVPSRIKQRLSFAFLDILTLSSRKWFLYVKCGLFHYMHHDSIAFCLKITR